MTSTNKFNGYDDTGRWRGYDYADRHYTALLPCEFSDKFGVLLDVSSSLSTSPSFSKMFVFGELVGKEIAFEEFLDALSPYNVFPSEGLATLSNNLPFSELL